MEKKEEFSDKVRLFHVKHSGFEWALRVAGLFHVKQACVCLGKGL